MYTYSVFCIAFHGVEQHRGAVFLFSKSHGAVRCGVYFLRILRCGADSLLDGAVRCGLCFSRIVRCGAVRLSAEQFFPTVLLSVHRS